MDKTLQTVTQLLHQLVIHQPPRDPFNDKDKFDILGGKGGGDVGGGDYGGFCAYGDIGSGGYSGGGVDYSGGGDGHDFTELWPCSNNGGGSFWYPAPDHETKATKSNNPKTTVRSRLDSSSNEVGKNMEGTVNDDLNHHQSSSQLWFPPLSLSTNLEHHGDAARQPMRQPKDTLSIARDPRPVPEHSRSLADAEEVDFGTSITSLFEDEIPYIYDTSELHVNLDESSLDLSQPHEYGLGPAYASAEPQTLFQTPFGSEAREDTAPTSLSSSFLNPPVPDKPVSSLQARLPGQQQEESRKCTSAKWDNHDPSRHEDSLFCSSYLEGPEDFEAHDELSISPGFHPQPVKPLQLACPYFKYDPNTYGQRRTCRGTSYDTTHRLKEHLYRSHKQKPRCPRCGKKFSQNSDKNKHLSQPIACNVVEGITADGFDSDQEKELRSKKRKRNSLKTEEDKWAHIFRILFGDSVAVPPPYYLYHTANPSQRDDSHMMCHRDVERVLSEDVPRDLEEQTFSQVEAISGHPLPQAKRRQILGIFRWLFFRQLTGANDPASVEEDVRASNGPRSTSHTNNIAGASEIDSRTISTHGAQLTPESRGQTSSQALSLRDEIVVEGLTSMDSGQALVHSTFDETDDGCNYDLWPTDMSLGTYGTFDEFYRVSDDFWAMASANGFPT